MKQTFFISAGLLLVFAACSRSPQTSGLLEDLEETVAAQQTVNHYLHTSVTPKLRTCWSRLQGEGTVDLALRYRKTDRQWIFERAEAIGSTPNEQAAAAVACMGQSASGSSFVLDEKAGGKAFERFVLKWTWLVPLPEEGSEAMARRAGGLTPGSGCAKCISNYPARCQWSQTGKEEDCRVEGPNACSTTGTKCLTGIYGRAGDMIVVF
jgi:hypothetical protein